MEQFITNIKKYVVCYGTFSLCVTRGRSASREYRSAHTDVTKKYRKGKKNKHMCACVVLEHKDTGVNVLVAAISFLDVLFHDEYDTAVYN